LRSGFSKSTRRQVIKQFKENQSLIVLNQAIRHIAYLPISIDNQIIDFFAVAILLDFQKRGFASKCLENTKISTFVPLIPFILFDVRL